MTTEDSKKPIEIQVSELLKELDTTDADDIKFTEAEKKEINKHLTDQRYNAKLVQLKSQRGGRRRHEITQKNPRKARKKVPKKPPNAKNQAATTKTAPQTVFEYPGDGKDYDKIRVELVENKDDKWLFFISQCCK